MYFLEDVRWTLIAVRVPVELEGSDSRIPPTRAIATERSEPVAGPRNPELTNSRCR